MEFESDVDIARSQADVFDAMADGRNEVHWNTRVSSSVLKSGEPIGLGTKFTTVNRGQEYEATISTYDKPAKLDFEVTGKMMDITARFSLEAVGDEPRGCMRLST